MKQKKPFNNHFFNWVFSIIFPSLLANLLIFYGLNVLDQQTQIFSLKNASLITTLSVFLGISIAVSVMIALLVSKRLSKPFESIKSAINETSKGNFNVKIAPTKNTIANEIIQNFNKMTNELKSIETLKADFISNVSHEFKTPLSVIQSYAKALAKPDLPDNTKTKYAEIIDNNIKKLTTLTSNILTLSKLDNQKIDIEKTSFCLDEQIRQNIVLLAPKWQAKNLNFEIDMSTAHFVGPKELVSQVWQNLLDNAIKFSRPNTVISISLKNINQTIVVKIADQGIGIAKEKIAHIFDKFYQADSSHSSAGNGLGLALVKKIVEISNGTIHAESQENVGSTFTVVLPNNK